MEKLLETIYDPNDFRQMGHQLIDLLADHHEANMQGTRPQAIPWKNPEQHLQYWQDVATGEQSVTELFKTILEQSTAVHHPR